MKANHINAKKLIILLVLASLNGACGSINDWQKSTCSLNHSHPPFTTQITDFGQATPMNLGTKHQAYRFFNSTDDSPILVKQGNYFGFSYTASLLPEVSHCYNSGNIPITIEIYYPLNNQKITKKQWKDAININRKNYAVWHFSSSKIIHSGNWKIKVLHNNQPLIEKEFTLKRL